MDFDQIKFERQTQEKLPFYLAYSMQNVYEMEQEYAKEAERMQQFYPLEVQSIQQRIEDLCDRMEYEGSTMFDEMPDRVRLYSMVKKIYQETDKDHKPEKNKDLWHLIEVMLYHEMYLRSCRHKRCQRFW